MSCFCDLNIAKLLVFTSFFTVLFLLLLYRFCIVFVTLFEILFLNRFSGPLAKHSSDNAAEANNGLCTKENAAHFCQIVEAFSILNKSSFIEACVQCLELFSDHMVHILTDVDTSQSVGDILTMVSQIYHFVVYCIEYTVEFVTDSSKNDESLMSHKFDDLYPTQTQLKNFLPTDIRNVSFAPTILDRSEIEGFNKEISSHIEEYLVNRIRKYVDDQLSYVKTIKSLTKIKTELTRIVSWNKVLVQIRYSYVGIICELDVKSEILENLS